MAEALRVIRVFAVAIMVACVPAAALIIAASRGEAIGFLLGLLAASWLHYMICFGLRELIR